MTNLSGSDKQTFSFWSISRMRFFLQWELPMLNYPLTRYNDGRLWFRSSKSSKSKLKSWDCGTSSLARPITLSTEFHSQTLRYEVNIHSAAITSNYGMQYAIMAEVLGRGGYIAPQAVNCSAPDTGNMGKITNISSFVLISYRPLQRFWQDTALRSSRKNGWSLYWMVKSALHLQWPKKMVRVGFQPQTIRCSYCSPVASSDATNIRTSIRREGDEIVINGHKWRVSFSKTSQSLWIYTYIAQVDKWGWGPKNEITSCDGKERFRKQKYIQPTERCYCSCGRAWC